ncbi:hypothetical protein ZA09C12_07630 [Escherichia coli]|nr:hypothetical protein VEE11_21420 [Escherichia coli]
MLLQVGFGERVVVSCDWSCHRVSPVVELVGSPIVIIKSITGDAYSGATGCDSQVGPNVKD